MILPCLLATHQLSPLIGSEIQFQYTYHYCSVLKFIACQFRADQQRIYVMLSTDRVEESDYVEMWVLP